MDRLSLGCHGKKGKHKHKRKYKHKGKYKNNRPTCDGLGAGGTPLREELAEALGAVRLVVAAREPLTSQRPEDTVWLFLLLKISKFQRFNYFHWIVQFAHFVQLVQVKHSLCHGSFL